MSRSVNIGKDAEERARELLTRHGLTLVTRNFHCRGGEIDLVMRDRDALVFVEVRYRRSTTWGGAVGSVDARKQQRLLLAARNYLARHNWSGPCRFDVVAFEGSSDPHWIRDAISA